MKSTELVAKNQDTIVMKRISDALGIAQLPAVLPELQHAEDYKPLAKPDDVVLSPDEELAHDDFNESRQVLLDTLHKGQLALQEALKIACTSQTGAAFEAVSKLIKNISEANRGLLELHEAHRALMPTGSQPSAAQAANTINNNNFIVTNPSQLLDMARQARQESNVIDVEVKSES